MHSLISLYKPVGKTPLEAIALFRKKYPEYTQTLSYAGRLDPMAEGLLLVLVGEENKKRKHYEAFEKTYEFSALFGISTDSYDVLGLPTIRTPRVLNSDESRKLQNFVKIHTGTFTQSFPPFSSKPVKGKPLFYWAREGKLADITIPTKEVTITECRELASDEIDTSTLYDYVFPRIESVTGNFRQEEILESWIEALTGSNRIFTRKSFRIACSSGTYVRSFIHNMGESIQTGAVALSIKRTAVGPYTLDHAVHV